MDNNIAAILIESYTYGGSDKIAQTLIENLSFEKKYFFINKRSPSVNLFKNIKHKNIYSHYYSLLTPAELGTFALKFEKYLFFYYLFRTFNLLIRYPLLVISFFYFRYYFKKYKINIFISNNGGYPGGEFNRSSTLAASFIPSCTSYHIFHSLPVYYNPYLQKIERFYDYLLDKRATFITDSISSAKKMKQTRNIKQDIYVIYNGVKPQQQKKYSTNEQPLKLLNIGSIDHNKNQMMLLKAMHILINNLHLDIYLYLVGNPNDIDYDADLKDFSINNNLQNNIFFESFVLDPTSYYNQCDIFVLSSNIESFPTVILEAMSVGMPIITTNAGGVSEQIINEYNGNIVQQNDIPNMVQKICHFYEHRSKIQQYGEASYQLYNKKFELNTMIKNYNTLFEKAKK